MRTFVLFDLDGTVIRPGARVQRLHMSAMAAAITDVTGIDREFKYSGNSLYYGDLDTVGFTDASTVHAALCGNGISPSEADGLLEPIIDQMVRRVLCADEGRPDGTDRDCLLPGIRALAELLVTQGVSVGMSTGNAVEIARWKMRRTGLGDLLREGGFGHHERERRRVAAQAVATMSGGQRSAGLLIGDTASDVHAAHANALRCVAVATGAATADELRAAGPDAVVDDLVDPAVPGLILRLLELDPSG